MRKWFAVAALAVFWCAPTPARAQLGEGERAPNFEGKEFINSAKCDLKSLRGRIILYEVFRTWWHFCYEQVVHLNELWNKYKDKGVVVIYVTNEPRGLVDAFVAKYGPQFPVVIETTNSIEAYEGTGFPTQVAIGPDGKIIGNSFSEQMIADYLPKQHLPPKLPEKLAAAYQKLLDKDKVADARKMLADVAGGKGSDEEKAAADGMVKWIDEGAASSLTLAAETDTKGDPAAAAEIYEDLVKTHAGLDPAKQAADALKALLADPAKKKEVDAGKALAKARVEAADETMAKKKIAVLNAVAVKWKGTKAGDKAAQLIAKLEEQQKKK